MYGEVREIAGVVCPFITWKLFACECQPHAPAALSKKSFPETEGWVGLSRSRSGGEQKNHATAGN
jgi:hypothetical protein